MEIYIYIFKYTILNQLVNAFICFHPHLTVCMKLNAGTVTIPTEIPIKYQGTDKYPIIYF